MIDQILINPKQNSNDTKIINLYHAFTKNKQIQEYENMAKSKLAKANEKIAEVVVGGFNKIEDKFVDSFLTKEGESVEEAKARLAAEQKERRKAGLE